MDNKGFTKHLRLACNYLLSIFLLSGFAFAVQAQSDGSEDSDSALSAAVKNDESILAAALNNVGAKFLGDSGAEANDVAESVGIKVDSRISPLEGISQIEGAYEYTSWGSRNPFVSTGALAFELGIGLENLILEEQPEANNTNQVVEVQHVNVENSRVPEPLEFFDINSLVFKGRFTNVFGEPVALISGPNNVLYKGTVGDRVGLSQAKVVQVSDTEVVLLTGNIINRIPLSVAADF